MKESLEIGREGEGPGRENMWPTTRQWEGAEAFKRDMLEFFDVCKELHVELMRAFALALGIGEEWFDEYTDRGDNTLRLLHYPKQSREVFRKNKNQVRAGAHSDYGSITLLFQDQAGGLQVQMPDGRFRDVRPVEGAIVVNAGDLLSRWSNDMVKSTIHRVMVSCYALIQSALSAQKYVVVLTLRLSRNLKLRLIVWSTLRDTRLRISAIPTLTSLSMSFLALYLKTRNQSMLVSTLESTWCKGCQRHTRRGMCNETLL